ncbi:MAG: zinc-binding dehydrogenase, partial [Thermomicrobiales bacterium]
AKGFGATHTVNPLDGDAVAMIKEITGGYGVNASFEAVGKPQTIETALWCRDLAGRCVIIGVADQQAKVELPIAKFFDVGGSLRISWYGDCLPTRDFPMLAAWYEQGKLDLDGVVTRRITIDETEEAFHAMERGETLRSVIVL